MTARRVIDPRQQGARLSWGNDLFQQVERVQLPTPPMLPAMDLPEVTYLEPTDESEAP